MIACVSSPPDAAPVSNHHITRSRALYGHRVWVPWLPVFTRPQAKRCLYAAIQLSRYCGVLICPFTYMEWERLFVSPFFEKLQLFLRSAQNNEMRVFVCLAIITKIRHPIVRCRSMAFFLFRIL